LVIIQINNFRLVDIVALTQISAIKWLISFYSVNLSEGVYYWRVRAVKTDTSDWSGWSDVWNFNFAFNTTLSVSNLSEGVYYWRVRAKDYAGNLSGWSDVWSYEIDMTAPNTPYLVTPVGGYLRNTIITFIWTRVSKMSKDGEKPALSFMTSILIQLPILRMQSIQLFKRLPLF